MQTLSLVVSLLLLSQRTSSQGSPLAPSHHPTTTASSAKHLKRTWFSTYGGRGSELPWDVVRTSDDCFQLSGQTFSTDMVMGDAWVLQLSPLGSIRWQMGIGGAGADEFQASIATPDGGTLHAGSTASSGAGGTDGWLVKLGPTGVIQWQRTYGTPGDERFTALVESPNGYYVGGTCRSKSGLDAWVLAVDENGAVSWQQSIGGSGDDDLTTMAATNDGLAFAANSNSDFGVGSVAFSRPWLVKLDLQGGVLWQKTYDISSGDRWNHLIALEEGGFVATGEAQAMAFFRGDLWVMRLGVTGDVVWDRRLGDNFGNTWVDSGADVVRTPDGGFLAAGTTGTVNPFEDIWLVKLSSDGGHEWDRALGESSTEYGHALFPVQDGGYVVAGFRPGVGEALVLRVSSNGETGSSCGNMGPTKPNIWTTPPAVGAPSVRPLVTSVVPASSSAMATTIGDAGAFVCLP